MIYECTVKLLASTPRWFDIKTGVRQGCLISPFLFVIVTDFITKKLGAVHTSALLWTLTSKLSYLAYTDDNCQTELSRTEQNCKHGRTQDKRREDEGHESATLHGAATSCD